MHHRDAEACCRWRCTSTSEHQAVQSAPAVHWAQAWTEGSQRSRQVGALKTPVAPAAHPRPPSRPHLRRTQLRPSRQHTEAAHQHPLPRILGQQLGASPAAERQQLHSSLRQMRWPSRWRSAPCCVPGRLLAQPVCCGLLEDLSSWQMLPGTPAEVTALRHAQAVHRSRCRSRQPHQHPASGRRHIPHCQACDGFPPVSAVGAAMCRATERRQRYSLLPCAGLPSAGSSDQCFRVQGYRAQAGIVQSSLEALVASCAARQESLVCEGVLLSPACLQALMACQPGVMPFLIHIRNEAKHRERFAVRVSSPLAAGCPGAGPACCDVWPGTGCMGCTDCSLGACSCQRLAQEERSRLAAKLHLLCCAGCCRAARAHTLVWSSNERSPVPAAAVAAVSSSPVAGAFGAGLSTQGDPCGTVQVRAKYMTLDAGGNRYVHHLQAIRSIQSHLMAAAKEARVCSPFRQGLLCRGCDEKSTSRAQLHASSSTMLTSGHPPSSYARPWRLA